MRSLKAGGASKADVAPEVTILLELKQKLAVAQGSPLESKTKKGKANNAAPALPAKTSDAQDANNPEAERLQALVTAQVRGACRKNFLLAVKYFFYL